MPLVHGLVDYGSDSDNDSEPCLQGGGKVVIVQPVAKPEIKCSSSKGGNAVPSVSRPHDKIATSSKPLKKTFFLPTEIQAALERRLDSDSDSDDHQALIVKKLKASAEAARHGEHANTSSVSFLSLLPAPQHDGPILSTPAEFSSSIDVSVGSVPTKAFTSAASLSAPKASRIAVNAAPSVRATHPPNTVFYGTPSGAHSHIPASHAATSDQDYESTSLEGLSKRQRERLLERQLITGNLDAVAQIASSGSAIDVEIQDPSLWNPSMDTAPKSNPEGVRL